MSKVYAVIGGDERQKFLYEMMLSDGVRVVSSGLKDSGDAKTDFVKVLRIADVLILPLPLSRDGKCLNAPGLAEKISVSELFDNLSSAQSVYAGNVNKNILETAAKKNIKIIDYFNAEKLNILNTIPTAEGAVAAAFANTSTTVFGSNCFVCGFGRVGKTLARTLRALNARVFVGARKDETLAWIKAEGFESIKLENIQKPGFLSDMNIIFNTVPSLIFDKKILSLLDKNVLLIDLASLPGGTDFSIAAEMGIKTIHALSLPGLAAPLSAAEYIKDTIYEFEILK